MQIKEIRDEKKDFKRIKKKIKIKGKSQKELY